MREIDFQCKPNRTQLCHFKFGKKKFYKKNYSNVE